ncbi:unnamed protein product [Dovyalis caffra]|uniref:Uncharacterized protein n=2 Tax=Dovyalis caffra TaxID=77055 RepID=A0AAV1R758_9ROSI|nr:unnamed protein product [Dovyalis caffra]
MEEIFELIDMQVKVRVLSAVPRAKQAKRRTRPSKPTRGSSRLNRRSLTPSNPRIKGLLARGALPIFQFFITLANPLIRQRRSGCHEGLQRWITLLISDEVIQALKEVGLFYAFDLCKVRLDWELLEAAVNLVSSCLVLATLLCFVIRWAYARMSSSLVMQEGIRLAYLPRFLIDRFSHDRASVSTPRFTHCKIPPILIKSAHDLEGLATREHLEKALSQAAIECGEEEAFFSQHLVPKGDIPRTVLLKPGVISFSAHDALLQGLKHSGPFYVKIRLGNYE